MFRKIYLVFALLFSCFLLAHVAFCLPAISMETLPFFRLGIELQEVSGLCPRAKRDYRVQKRPIFKVSVNGIYVWHVEIDGDDIEFVTEPFEYEQKGLFKQCMASIENAISCLRPTRDTKFSFEQWITVCKKKGIEFSFVDNQLKNREIHIPGKEWCPIFAPQVTIQHPLEWTIPLYVAMVMSIPQKVNESTVINRCENSNELLLQHTIPFRENVKNISDRKQIKLLFNLYHNKLLGLMVLNALTMESIGNSGQTDDESLKSLFEASQLCGQFDAKMNLMFMSRRPFSQMYLDIGGDTALVALVRSINSLFSTQIRGGYADVFQAVMMSNANIFCDAIKAFCKSNYGEQYYGKDGAPLNLLPFMKKISEGLRIGQNEAIKTAYNDKLISHTVNMVYLTGLLKNGIITTTMLRNLSEQHEIVKYFKDDYYIDVLKSISNPRAYEKRYDLAVENNQEINFTGIEHPYDLLSPPIFLDCKSDSMGHHNAAHSPNDRAEALIEVRIIHDVGDFFIRQFLKLDPNNTKGRFLKNTDNLQVHALALLDGLHKFEKMIQCENSVEQVMTMLRVFACKGG